MTSKVLFAIFNGTGFQSPIFKIIQFFSESNHFSRFHPCLSRQPGAPRTALKPMRSGQVGPFVFQLLHPPFGIYVGNLYFRLTLEKHGFHWFSFNPWEAWIYHPFIWRMRPLADNFFVVDQWLNRPHPAVTCIFILWWIMQWCLHYFEFVWFLMYWHIIYVKSLGG